MIQHKTSLNKFQKIEIISSIFSDHKGLKLETNPKGKKPKHSNHGDSIHAIEWVENEIREENKNSLETSENELITI